MDVYITDIMHFMSVLSCLAYVDYYQDLIPVLWFVSRFMFIFSLASVWFVHPPVLFIQVLFLVYGISSSVSVSDLGYMFRAL